MFSKILFPTDFSEYAAKTLDCIAGFPGVREVVLLHVVKETRSPRGGGEIGKALFHDGRITLREEKHHLESLGENIRVQTVVKVASDIAGAIVQAAEENGVSLVVIGARGSSLVEGILLGSVSKAVVRRSRTSVLIMRHKITQGLDGKTYEMFCPMILSRVLCPVDFSSYSDDAIARLHATPGVGEAILLCVVSRGETKEEIEDNQRRAREKIEIIRKQFAAQGIRARAIVRLGNPAFEITKVAEEEDVSVIWMSSVGRGWFAELLIGSTAGAVAVNSRRPVIIVRSKDT
ncbi:MAG TPA: universal stress protein [Methanolinea sp.]|jgi:nucleotide-binding universal stress UspA family protein|nr:MAG: Universal stress protein [Methanoregulaceae archaeon PtaB.Bin009]OPY39636.1 MAG: Universal stress protein [Methanoregulaceae archaeon PtaU1.Bin066]HII76982.1 universal stress protein [Methanolinea sp.]HNQ29889.1 universal stress protein [Methanolinea sp.]